MNFVNSYIKDRIGYIVLNRPEKRNALNSEFVSELKQIIKGYENREDVRALILKSSGDVFCAGADLAYLQQLQNFTYDENLSDSRSLAELFRLIYAFPKPVISLVNGAAIAGGCGLATVCDMCFATPNSSFGYTESRIGFIPAIVMIFLIKKIGETLSKKLLFTGELFNANQALEYGLITEVVDLDIELYVHQFAVRLVEQSSGNSLSMIKELYVNIDGLALDEAIDYACKMNATARETEDCKRGISGFLNRIKFTW